MENHPDHEYQRIQLLRAIRHAQIDPGELWLHYFGLAGDAGEYEVEAYLHGSFTLPPLQRDLLAHAANELIDRLPAPPRAPYSTDLVPDGADGDTAAEDTAADGSGSVASPGGPGGTPLDWLLGRRAGGASAPDGTGSAGSTDDPGTGGGDSTGADRPSTHMPDGPDDPGGPESGPGTS
ncbi:hypothetical protein [Arthrobacter sp. B0490]|uniref:hypothetical protein n=1 Tax=Arthrobacter sp. B0490 TaxID=2058891 RepID=UPI0015E29835|nr:hypothetical protein [Arthrobacter sp. B0490]